MFFIRTILFFILSIFLIPLHAFDHFDWYNQLFLESNLFSIQQLIIKNEENIPIDDYSEIVRRIDCMQLILYQQCENEFR